MPVGQPDGCLSTVWYLARCTMVKTRPAQRNTDAGSISRTAHTRGQKALRVTVSLHGGGVRCPLVDHAAV
jgi:hypothetical protein